MKNLLKVNLFILTMALQACYSGENSNEDITNTSLKNVSSNSSANNLITANNNGNDNNAILLDGVLHQIWESTNDLTQLKNKTDTGVAPDSEHVYQSTTSGQQLSNNYGSRMHTRITVEDSGTYQFYIASDDSSELYFAELGQPMEKIAFINGWVRFQAWNKKISQQSREVQLESGKVYRLEALHVDTGGGDHLSIGWTKNAGTTIEVISDIEMKYEAGTTPAFICGAAGDWTLDNELSQLSFVTTKNTHIVESHEFHNLTGDISNNVAQLSVNLNSVDTGIELRNERILEHLFQVSSYPLATATVAVPNTVAALNAGETLSTDITLSVDLHGTQNTIDSKVIISCISQDVLMIKNERPVLISAEDYELTGGIETLRNLASLLSITPTVPVDLVLIYKR